MSFSVFVAIYTDTIHRNIISIFSVFFFICTQIRISLCGSNHRKCRTNCYTPKMQTKSKNRLKMQRIFNAANMKLDKWLEGYEKIWLKFTAAKEYLATNGWRNPTRKKEWESIEQNTIIFTNSEILSIKPKRLKAYTNIHPAKPNYFGITNNVGVQLYMLLYCISKRCMLCVPQIFITRFAIH